MTDDKKYLFLVGYEWGSVIHNAIRLINRMDLNKTSTPRYCGLLPMREDPKLIGNLEVSMHEKAVYHHYSR
jgi:hypothetical protein